MNALFKNRRFGLFFIGAVVAILLWLSPEFKMFLSEHLLATPMLGAFIGGFLFVMSFGIVTGSVILCSLTPFLSPFLIALLAGLGGVLGDLIIFSLTRGSARRIEKVGHSRVGKFIRTLRKSHHFSWTLPVIGAILIASPFPDEIGAALMGISRIKLWQFLCIALILDIAGVYILIEGIRIFSL